MHSKRRYKICTLSYYFSILQGLQSENFSCSLTYCESENFSDSSLRQIDSESFRFWTKITWPGRWNVQKLTSENRIGNFIHLYLISFEICTQIKRSSSCLLGHIYFTKNKKVAVICGDVAAAFYVACEKVLRGRSACSQVDLPTSRAQNFPRRTQSASRARNF